MNFSPADRPLQRADIAIHCGDLTDGSKLEEYRMAIELLKDLDTPLELAIAGNHDFTMDVPAFEKKVAEATQSLDSELLAREYGTPGEAKQLFEEAKDAGIILLDEGTHCFELENGALLTVYASPYTPAFGAWGFQRHPNQGYKFSIEAGVDVVVTHGPPKGIMDYINGQGRAGCPDLFAAIARARPLLHCFGHIHEGWGAKLVTWRECDGEQQPNHFTSIDNDRSPLIEKLAGLVSSIFDTQEDIERKLAKSERYKQERCCKTSHCRGDEYPLEHGGQTLFINASFSGCGDLPVQRPWLVDIELPRAQLNLTS